MSYVIYLDSTAGFSENSNDYGYWAGQSYFVQRVAYPIWDREITDRTKRYKHYKNNQCKGI